MSRRGIADPVSARRRYFDEFEARRRSMRRAQRAFFAIWFFFVLAMVFGAAWLLSNPEAIGSFVGRIAAAFNAAGAR
ncbi:hypothetical protein [Sphingomonas sp. IC4-52]|uniref:hypothetical protein n=1 Tax=Sphingomonas sp. IC4-52 TaxID=2887202 RepID=UPI001D12D705|nr:hypothetical protein [Sphingomonas sp. IC4-52]MCC2978822.1 hypothetical protein [Sphingomonas sp. IC4-52]